MSVVSATWEAEVGGSLEPRSSRSEEHTSELQSPCNLVCRLLLEKKKKTHKITNQPFATIELCKVSTNKFCVPAVRQVMKHDVIPTYANAKQTTNITPITELYSG